MRKRVWILSMLLLLSFSFDLLATPQFFNREKRYTWADKLKRGAVNIVTSPVEVARQIQITSGEKNLLNGWTIGLVVGLGNGLMRFGTGAIDLVTFPFGFPDSKKAPLIDPEYVWQKPGVKYS